MSKSMPVAALKTYGCQAFITDRDDDEPSIGVSFLLRDQGGEEFSSEMFLLPLSAAERLIRSIRAAVQAASEGDS